MRIFKALLVATDGAGSKSYETRRLYSCSRIDLVISSSAIAYRSALLPRAEIVLVLYMLAALLLRARAAPMSRANAALLLRANAMLLVRAKRWVTAPCGFDLDVYHLLCAISRRPVV